MGRNLLVDAQGRGELHVIRGNVDHRLRNPEGSLPIDIPTGFAMWEIKHTPSALEINLNILHVFKPYRDDGIGSALVGAFKDWVDSEKVDVIHCDAISPNSFEFLKHHGFEEADKDSNQGTPLKYSR